MLGHAPQPAQSLSLSLHQRINAFERHSRCGTGASRIAAMCCRPPIGGEAAHPQPGEADRGELCEGNV
jgi:hypothetical protein